MRKPPVVLILFLFFFLAGRSLSAECLDSDLVNTAGPGLINWSKGQIEAKGKAVPPETYQGHQEGRSMAVRDAIETARKNLYDAVREVRIDSTSIIADKLKQNEVVAQKLKAMVKEAKIVNQKYLTDGTVEVTAQLCLCGGFAQLMLPFDIKQIEAIKPIQSKKERKKDNITDAEHENMHQSVRYTGMVVDARGVPFEAALAPKILDESGEEIFGATVASREFAVQKGMAGYGKDIAIATQDPRVADHPLIVKGLKTKGLGRCDVIVSTSDANRLRSHFHHLAFLKECNVMIVVD